MKILGYQIPFTSRNKSSVITPRFAVGVDRSVPVVHKSNPKELAAPVPKEVKTAIAEIPVLGGSKYKGSVMPTNYLSFFGYDGIFLERPMTDLDFDTLYEYGHTNHDISYAKDNIVQLASGNFTITLPENIAPAVAAKMQTELRDSLEKWYVGGRTRLINDLLRQVALFGCISAEGQPNNRLSGVGRVVLLAPKYVYFGWDNYLATYVPYQQSFVGGTGFSGASKGGYNKLNPLTYSYMAYEQWREDIPYSVPPFLSALRAACIENDMLDNLSMITRRLGLLGFLKVTAAAPTRATVDGVLETEEAYQSRVLNFLYGLEGQVENGLSNGYVISAKQYDENGNEIAPDFDMTASTADASGARELMEMIIQIKSAGLKQDPAMLGKNFSTTESLITVILTKFSTQLMNYQALVAQFLEKIFSLHLLLSGYGVVSVKVALEAPMLQDTKLQFEGQSAKFDYYNKLFLQGIISQQQFSNFMGFSTPYKAAPPPPPAAPMKAF